MRDRVFTDTPHQAAAIRTSEGSAVEVVLAPAIIRVSGTPDDSGSHDGMLDLPQRLREPTEPNAGEEVFRSYRCRQHWQLLEVKRKVTVPVGRVVKVGSCLRQHDALPISSMSRRAVQPR